MSFKRIQLIFFSSTSGEEVYNELGVVNQAGERNLSDLEHNLIFLLGNGEASADALLSSGLISKSVTYVMRRNSGCVLLFS